MNSINKSKVKNKGNNKYMVEKIHCSNTCFKELLKDMLKSNILIIDEKPIK